MQSDTIVYWARLFAGTAIKIVAVGLAYLALFVLPDEEAPETPRYRDRARYHDRDRSRGGRRA